MTRKKFLIWASFAVILDQISKSFAQRFTEIYLNRGISFGLSIIDNQYVMSFILLIVAFLLWRAFKDLWRAQPLVAGIFFGSTASNILDRVVFGGVRDWLLIPGTMIYNNVADWLIFFSIAYLLIKQKPAQQT